MNDSLVLKTIVDTQLNISLFDYLIRNNTIPKMAKMIRYNESAHYKVVKKLSESEFEVLYEYFINLHN